MYALFKLEVEYLFGYRLKTIYIHVYYRCAFLNIHIIIKQYNKK
ncbi:Uncharacterised protein [Bacillus cereus]|nr:Uncharacterised protein [Bacillus cereus]